MENVTNLLRLEQQITDGWSRWPTPALHLHPCKYSSHIILVSASGHRNAVTFRFNLYMSSAMWSSNHPTSTKADLRPPFTPTVRCYDRPSFLSFKPVRQTMPSDSRLRPGFHGRRSAVACTARPLRLHFCTMEADRSGSPFCCGTPFTKKELYLYLIVFVAFVSPAYCALSLPVGYCNYSRMKYVVCRKVLVWPKKKNVYRLMDFDQNLFIYN